MLDYEWGNPSSIMLTDDEPNNTYDSDPNRPFFPHFSQSFNDHPGLLPTQYNPFNPQIFLQTQTHFDNPTHFNSLYDPRAYANSYPIEPGYMVIPKTEPAGGGGVADLTDRIGLNLGGRTYFSSSEDDFVNRLYNRTRPLEAGFVNAPKCQAEGCNADLTHAKHYHRRHKVCEFHSKASTVIAAGLTQRFCQQCSRFHLLTEFDNGKRSCRRRLADHNRRRRKSTQQPYQDQNKSHLTNTQNSSSESFARSPPDSGAQSSSSVTIGVSPPPPRISSDCFRPYQSTTTTNTSPASANSLFYV